MQTIKHPKDYTFIHPIFNEFEKLYTALSNNDEVEHNSLFNNVDRFDVALKTFETIFNEYGNCRRYLEYSDKQYTQLPQIKYKENNVIVAFSGGKDSTATALYYKNRGYNVYLYHIHGLNRFFPKEQQAAEEIARYLNLPIIIENVKLSGISLYPDHPLKNIIISNMALQYGIRNNIGTFIAFGDYSTAHLKDVRFETSGDDCVEMWDAYIPIIQQYIPQFKFETPLVNILETLECLERDKWLLSLTQSCVMTHRFKNYHNKRVQNKYGIQLLPNRCGTCWKCALEYIYYTDKDVLRYDKEYYRYCLTVLQKNLKEEQNLSVKIDDVWDYYCFYDKGDSKYYGCNRNKSNNNKNNRATTRTINQILI